MKTHDDRNDYDESHKIIKSSGHFLQFHYEHWRDLIASILNTK